MADSDLTNQKPDKLWQCDKCGGIGTDIKAIQDGKCHPTKSDTTLRSEIEEVIKWAQMYQPNHDDYLTPKQARRQILNLLANRLPLYKYTVEAPRTKLKEAHDEGYNQALSEVRAIIEGRNGL